jgi:hypothetical protein
MQHAVAVQPYTSCTACNLLTAGSRLLLLYPLRPQVLALVLLLLAQVPVQQVQVQGWAALQALVLVLVQVRALVLERLPPVLVLV